MRLLVQAASWKNAVDATIQVPFSANLKLSSNNEADIAVENVSGEIEADNLNGSLSVSFGGGIDIRIRVFASAETGAAIPSRDLDIGAKKTIIKIT